MVRYKYSRVPANTFCRLSLGSYTIIDILGYNPRLEVVSVLLDIPGQPVHMQEVFTSMLSGTWPSDGRPMSPHEISQQVETLAWVVLER